MQNLFPGYYNLSDQELQDLLKKGLVVPDANVLLNFYRYTPTTASDLLKLFKHVDKRLWIPHQVGLEFNRNRRTVIRDQIKMYDKVTALFEDTLDKLEALMVRGHMSINPSIVGKTKQALDRIAQELNKDRQQHPDLQRTDPIHQDLSDVIGDKIGSEYDLDWHDAVANKGEQRYANEIPPGFKDIAKDRSRRFGDLIVWFQIIEKAKATKRDVLLITDDVKPDWWWIDNDTPIGPHPYLVREMKKEANVRFHIMQPANFMTLAGQYFNIQLGLNTISEVQNTTETTGTWKEDIKRSFERLGGKATWAELYEHIQANARRGLPKNWQAVVRYTVFTNSSDSESFGGGEDLFTQYARGTWGLKNYKE